MLYSSRWTAEPALASGRFFVPLLLVVAPGPGLLCSQQPLASHALLPVRPKLEGSVLQADRWCYHYSCCHFSGKDWNRHDDLASHLVDWHVRQERISLDRIEGRVLHSSWRPAQPAFPTSWLFVSIELVVEPGPRLLRS